MEISRNDPMTVRCRSNATRNSKEHVFVTKKTKARRTIHASCNLARESYNEESNIYHLWHDLWKLFTKFYTHFHMHREFFLRFIFILIFTYVFILKIIIVMGQHRYEGILLKIITKLFYIILHCLKIKFIKNLIQFYDTKYYYVLLKL